MGNNDECNYSDRVNFTIAIYNQEMEEIRDRRKVEWQTFIVVNAI